MENWRRFIAESGTIAAGMCYPFAVNMAKNSQVSDRNDLKKFKVVHGRVTDKWSGESYDHAWVEKGELVFDDQTKFTKPDGIPKDVYYDMFQPKVSKEYTAAQTIVNCVNKGHAGPWNEEVQLEEAISLDIEVGDILLGGKYKNKRIEVKEIGEDELGQPTVNGKPILKVRIEKHLPDEKKSKKTLDMERDKGENKND